MNSDIQSRIREAANRFADQIIAVFGNALSSVASDLASEAPTLTRMKLAPASKRGRKPATRAPSATGSPGKRLRRSGQQLLEDAQRVLKLLATNKKGLRIEQINARLGTPPKQLTRPIQKLLDDGKIRKQGQKRATTYFSK